VGNKSEGRRTKKTRYDPSIIIVVFRQKGGEGGEGRRGGGGGEEGGGGEWAERVSGAKQGFLFANDRQKLSEGPNAASAWDFAARLYYLKNLQNCAGCLWAASG